MKKGEGKERETDTVKAFNDKQTLFIVLRNLKFITWKLVYRGMHNISSNSVTVCSFDRQCSSITLLKYP